LAISKQQKEELVEQYKKWVADSDGLILTHYHGLTVRDIGNLRKEIRESGGEFHIIKNTLAKRAFEESGRDWEEDVFTGPTALGISYQNPSGLAKVIKDFSQEYGTIEIKSGYLAERLVTIEEINALAELPSMGDIRAKMARTIAAPATQLAQILTEPGRQIAGVLKSYAEKEPAVT
jgi:large subunit ribosomal protein L10